MDCTQVAGEDRYLQIELGHRFANVRAQDVDVQRFLGDAGSSSTSDGS